jgi:hypothetical protein
MFLALRERCSHSYKLLGSNIFSLALLIDFLNEPRRREGHEEEGEEGE